MTTRVGICAALLVLACAHSAAAATCPTSIAGPNDPQFAPAERNPITGGTFNGEQWYLFDCIPQSTPLATDPDGAAGMSVNAAWQKYGRGSPEVIVAYMEGGVNWRKSDAPDLRRKAFLNTGELPLPQDKDGHDAGKYDLDGDGVVTVDDWKDDPRVKRPFLHEGTAKGITPEDLIVAFSDGKDGDGNGYVDDISGWNFHRDTNDPQTDQSIYAHANNESRVLAAEADNDFLGAGMCPNCRLLSVKLGDEAIDRPDRVAEGLVYAVDAGAKVIDITTAALGQSPSMIDAVEYAYRHNVTIAWASNDFESSDHTEGMRLPHVWPGNGVVADQTNRLTDSSPNDPTATTFRSRSSVTSYGAHALFSVASSDGSTSHSTPITAGVQALVASAGMEAAKSGQIKGPLSANEVFQVVRSTVSPITGQPCPTCFAGIEGAEWNLQYGYGRPNLLKAVEAVHENRIPPTADLVSPAWYADIDPTLSKRLAVQADVGAPRSSGYRWELQYATGPQPRDGDWKTFASGAGSAMSRVKGKLDLAQIPRSFWSGDYSAPTADRLSIERYDVSLRVKVVDSDDRVGVDRRVFYLRHDDSEIQALNKSLGSSIEPSPALADLEGRGRLDVVVAASDGRVHALRPDGHEVPGWPQRTKPARGMNPKYRVNYLRTPAWKSGKLRRPHEPIAAPPVVADLDRDGRVEVIANGLDGTLYVWNANGKRKRGFPRQTSRAYERQAVPVPDTPYVRNRSTGSFASPAVGDLNGDGKLEVVLGGWDGQVYAWQWNGKPLPGWPVSTDTPEPSHSPPGGDTFARDYKVCTTPVLVDVDGDKHLDVIVALQDTAFGPNGGTPVYGYVTGFHSDGTAHPGGALLPHMPLLVPAAIQGYGTAQDFITEGVQSPAAYTTPDGPRLVANAGLYFSHTFDLKTGQDLGQESPATLPAAGPVNPASPLIHFTTSPSLGKLGGGALAVAQTGSAVTDVATGVAATPGLGIAVRSGLAAWDPETRANKPALTQPIQGLGFVTATAIADVSGDGRPDVLTGTDSMALHAWDGATGQPVAGFPKWTGGWALWTPAIGDLDGDGRVEVVVGTREGFLHAYRTPGRAEANTEAWHWHQNDWATGHYGDDTRPPDAVRGLRVKRHGRNVSLSFRAPGDDWNVGTASRYELVVPIRKSRARAASRRIGLKIVAIRTRPRNAGEREHIHVRLPAGATGTIRVRAVDEAGNVGITPARRHR